MAFNRLAHRVLHRLAAIALLGGILLVSNQVTAAELSEIRSRGYLIVGVKDNLRPLGFRDPQGNLEGFEIELAHQLAAVLLGDAQAVQFQPLANTERLPAVLNGEVDLAIARVTATESRTRLVSFSTPYYLDGTAFITRGATIQQLRDLQQQPIAVLEGSDTIATVRSLLPNAQLVGVASYEAAQATLEAGEAIAFAADASVLTGWTQEDPQYRLLSPLISAEPLAVALPKGTQYDELRQQVNRAIEQWRSEGRLQQEVTRWGLPQEGVPELSSGS